MASTLQNLLKNKAAKEEATKEQPTAPVVNELKQELQQTDSTGKDYQPLPTTTNYYQALPAPTENKQPIKTIPSKKTVDFNDESVSPQKNYTKVANSITVNAIPQGLFKGLSKHTYDVLYKLTRGAINPTRSIQIPRLELMRLTGLSENTQRSHIKYLTMTGLVKVAYETGKHEGAVYEVFIPEELGNFDPTNPYQALPTTTNPYQALPTSTDNSQKLGVVTSQNLVGVSSSYDIENKELNSSPKTIYKTINDDDISALEIFVEKVGEAALELTGKKLNRADAERWGKLADLLVLELNIAAKRTGAVSNIPAFLTEVLRRKLLAPETEDKTPKAERSGSRSFGEKSAKLKKRRNGSRIR